LRGLATVFNRSAIKELSNRDITIVTVKEFCHSNIIGGGEELSNRDITVVFSEEFGDRDVSIVHFKVFGEHLQILCHSNIIHCLLQVFGNSQISIFLSLELCFTQIVLHIVKELSDRNVIVLGQEFGD